MNALVLQCGGPTAVVNASLAALVRRWRATFPLAELQGGRYGLAALLTGDWIPAASIDDDWISAAEWASGMALGGGRDRLGEQDLDRAIALLTSRGVHFLFLIGGNGTMAAGRVIAARAMQAGAALRIAGIPKTIDNDIPCTDICPGFASAARFLIESVRDVSADISSMGRYEDVVLIEAMGRHSGWLTAATLVARAKPSDAPHLVFVPEQPLSADAFLSAVRDQHARAGLCIAVVAEGVRDENGRFFAALGADLDVERDASGQVILGRSGGPLPYLAGLVRTQLGLRCRCVRPDVLQRCSRAHVVHWDRHIAARAGEAAVEWAAGAEGGDAVMIAIRRRGDGWGTECVPLDHVSGERRLPVNEGERCLDVLAEL
jgi:6-phosphofructokinase 1